MYIENITIIKIPRKWTVQSNISLSRIKKSRARSSMSREIVVGNLFERKINLFYRAFLSR